MPHWYDISGKLTLKIEGANGKQVKVDVRHAKKHRLFSGTTDIMRPLWDEGNKHWDMENSIRASLTHPKMAEEEESDWINRCIEEAADISKLCMQQGTEFHAAIAKFYTTGNKE